MPDGETTTNAPEGAQEPQNGVNGDEQSRAQQRIQELVTQRKEAESRLADVLATRETERQQYNNLQSLIEQRLPAPPEEEPEWQDPAEVAYKKTVELEAKLKAFEETRTREKNDASINYNIEQAVKGGEFDDDAWAMEEMAREYFANEGMRARGMDVAEFNAQAFAESLKKKETTRAQNWAVKKKQQAEETASAMSGGTRTSIQDPGLGDRPPWGSPERDQWDRETTAQILRKFTS